MVLLLARLLRHFFSLPKKPIDGVQQILDPERLFQVRCSFESLRHHRAVVAVRIDERHVAAAQDFRNRKAALPPQVDVEHRAGEALGLGHRQGLVQAGDGADDTGSASFQGAAEIVGDTSSEPKRSTNLRPTVSVARSRR